MDCNVKPKNVSMYFLTNFLPGSVQNFDSNFDFSFDSIFDSNFYSTFDSSFNSEFDSTFDASLAEVKGGNRFCTIKSVRKLNRF